MKTDKTGLFEKTPVIRTVEVLLVGLPSSIMNVMGIFSNITLNKLLVNYFNAAVAGIGIAKKIDMLSFAIANGLSQGVIPLIGYNRGLRSHAGWHSPVCAVMVKNGKSIKLIPAVFRRNARCSPAS